MRRTIRKKRSSHKGRNPERLSIPKPAPLAIYTPFSLIYAIIFVVLTSAPLLFLVNRAVNNVTLFYPYVFAIALIANLGLYISFKGLRITAVALTVALSLLYAQGFIGDLFGNGVAILSPATPALRVVTYNWLKSNPGFSDFQRWVSAQQPDIIAIEEVPQVFWKNYPSLSAQYPYTNHGPDDDDVVILSRYPLKQSSVLKIGDRELPHTVIDTPLGSIDVYAIHPQTVIDDGVWELRNTYITAASQVVDPSTARIIVLGDFNTSPWDPLYGNLRSTAHLHAQPRLLPPATRILSEAHGIKFGATIDHILVNDALRIEGCRTAPAMGSDHLPVMCDVYLK